MRRCGVCHNKFMRKIKLTRKESVLFILPFVVLCGVWWQSSRKSDLNPVLQKLAGPNAKDCSFSTMPVGEAKWKAMRDCAANSFQAKQPFWMREDNQVYEKGVDTGAALAQDGNYYQAKQTRGSWFSSAQIEITRGVGTKLLTNPQTGDRYIWSSGRVRVPNTH